MLRETIGPYRLETLLGRGGVGAVWRARHSTSGQCVALKTLESPVAAFLPTIRREVAALGQLRHRGIVRVLDSGSDGGLPWVAMELVEGPNLRVHVSQAVSSAPAGGERGLKPVLSVLRRLCEALAYLHGEGLVHRDLKPENVVVRADGQPVLVDFGLAARFGGGSSRETLALEAEPSGTLLYMAPEQLRGEMIDARADLYSLGCILYELLAGRPPFAGRSAAKLVQAHLHEAPVPAAWVIPVPSKSLEALVLRLLEKRPSHRLGHADDVAAALASLGAEAGPTGPRARPYLYRPELGGRQTILDAFETQFERLEGGAGGLVLLGGESGVGKSRLALELARRAERRGLRVLTGECQPLGLSGQATASGSSGPLHPLRKALQTIADRCRAFGADEAERLLGRRAKLLALYEPALDDLAGLEAHPEPAELPAQAARLRLYTFLTETFKALADDTATVLLLDDLQWADELTLGWLEYHLRSTGSTAQSQAALLVVGTYRTEEVVTGSLTPSGDTPASLLHPLLEAPGTVRLKLGRLEEAAVGQMVSEMLALEPAPLAFVRFLYRHSEGNPFFVAEYLRVAIAEGLLFRSEGFWRVAQGNQETPTESLYEALPLPRSLRETVQRRLLTLSAGAQELASAAAVLGRDMEASLLLAVAGTEAGKGLESLEELRAREVLEESAAGLFRFAHDKLREVAYERIGPGPRRVLHRAAAEAIEASRDAASIPVQDQGLATLGHHWEQAGADNKARDCYLAAARSAKNRNALNDAHELYRAYLRLVEQESTESIEARNEVAYDVLYPQGSLHEAKVLLEEALALARQTRATLLEATLLGNLGWLHNQQAELEEAWSLYEQGLGAARQAGDGLGEGTALNRMGVLRKDQGRMQDANSFYEQALAVALRIGDLRLEEAVLGNLGWLRSEEGRIEEAWALYERGLALARQTANRPHEGMMLGRMAVICHYRGKIELSLALQEQALRIQREVGNPRNVGRSLGNMGVLYYEQGRLEEAWDLLDQTLGVQRRVSDRVAEVLTLGNLGLVRAAQGRADEARTLIEDALALSRLLRNRPIEGASLGYLARVLGELGQVVEAMRVGAEALAIHREGGNHRLEAWVLADRARQVRRTSPHPGEALELALEAADAFRSSGRDLLPLAIAEQGHALLAAGHSCATALLEVRNLCREFGRTDPASECGHALARLERAQAAFEAGQALFRGEVWEDIPDALRRWLTETGHVDKIFAPHRSGVPSER